MRIKLRHNIFIKIALISILFTAAFLNNLHSEDFNYDQVCIPSSKQSKSLYLISPLKHTIRNSDGTVIDRNQEKGGRTERKNAVENDTASENNNLEIRKEGQSYYCEVELEDYNQRIQIAAYNLLGKKVIDIYRGQARKNYSYEINVSSLPNGLYICVVQGSNLRLTEKFIVSR